MREPLLGKVYKDIMKESGISLQNGAYILLSEFAKQMTQHGAPKRSTKDISYSLFLPDTSYSLFLRGVRNEEVMKGLIKSTSRKREHLFTTTFPLKYHFPSYLKLEKGPRQLIEEKKEQYRIFMSFPEDLRTRIYLLHQTGGHLYLKWYFEGLAKGEEIGPPEFLKGIAKTIKSNLKDDPETYKRVADLIMAFQFFYRDYPEEFEKKIKDFLQLELNTKNIPEEWTEGEIKPATVRKRLEDLALRN